jgi:two-component system sensor histidine kinase/response regulator
MTVKPIPILLIDDDEDDYLIIRNLLTKVPDHPFKIDWVTTFEQGREAIDRGSHSVYLVDYRLGAHDGLELLSVFDLVQRPQPFIILTGAGDERIEQKAMRMGVSDYLVKGAFSSELLSRVMRYAIQRKKMEAQRVKHLVDMNKAKDEFVALASHQLRTPATSVKVYLGMMLEGYVGTLSKQQIDHLQRAYDSNERQLKVVNDILRLAQLDLKKVTLNMVEVEVGALVDRIVQEGIHQAASRDQTIAYRKPDKPLIIVADELHLASAIGNILDNASKYSLAGKNIQVTVKKSLHDKIIISVQDEGLGIPKSEQDKLFKKFSRINNPLSVEAGGTGVGLYWSKEVISMHEGVIKVESKPDVGTTFFITLPST